MNHVTNGLTVLLLALLAACGGGGSDEEPTQNTPRVDCEANPVHCH